MLHCWGLHFYIGEYPKNLPLGKHLPRKTETCVKVLSKKLVIGEEILLEILKYE